MKNKFYALLYTLALFSSSNAIAEMKPAVKIMATTAKERYDGAADCKFVFTNFPINEDIKVSYLSSVSKDPKNRKVEWLKLFEDGTFGINKCRKAAVFDVNTKNTIKGEKVVARFETKEKVLAEISFVPKPLIFKSDKDSFSIEVILEETAPTTIYKFCLRGLKENDLLFFNSLSGSETLNSVYVHDPKQTFLYTPDVEGEISGEAKIKFTKSDDILAFSLPWGIAIKEQRKGKTLSLIRN